ncbi:hypothetical protein [Streptomyces blattellae]|uniref:hypothetical protein n=1 Tax=Streptomyces blattellae TaxID=2569855 RepID=UPI0012B71C7D|nr:hypothetical protein [Streptomyces blattellae]
MERSISWEGELLGHGLVVRPRTHRPLDYAPGVLPEDAVRDLAEGWFRALGALVDRAAHDRDQPTHNVRNPA